MFIIDFAWLDIILLPCHMFNVDSNSCCDLSQTVIDNQNNSGLSIIDRLSRMTNYIAHSISVGLMTPVIHVILYINVLHNNTIWKCMPLISFSFYGITSIATVY